MKNFSFKYVILICLLVFTGFFSWRVYFKVYTQEDTVNIHQFPRVVGSWKSVDLKVTEDEYAILETRNVFVREYTNVINGLKAYLFIVYSENNRKVSHPPEICYTGSGFSVLKKEKDILYGANGLEIPVNRLHLELGQAEQLSYYWFKVGKKFTGDYWVQQFQIVLNALFNKTSSSALIRVSTDVENNNYLKAEEVVKDFSNIMIPHLLPHLP